MASSRQTPASKRGAEARRAAQPPPRGTAGRPSPADLQRRLGNRGVTSLLSRETEAEKPPSSLAQPSVETNFRRSLAVSRPEDSHEREADRVAARLSRGERVRSFSASTDIATPCVGCGADQPASINREASAAGPGAAVLPPLGPGSPLQAGTRDHFEPLLGRRPGPGPCPHRSRRRSRSEEFCRRTHSPTTGRSSPPPAGLRPRPPRRGAPGPRADTCRPGQPERSWRSDQPTGS